MIICSHEIPHLKPTPMYLQFPINLTSLALVTTVIIFIIFKIWKKPKSSSVVKNLPPGPKKLPIIGDLHRLLSSVLFRSFRDLARTYGPLMHLKVGQVSVIVVSSREIAKLMFKEHDQIFANRFGSVAVNIMVYNCQGLGLCKYGDYWKQLRKIFTVELLSAKNIRSYGYIRREEVSRLVQAIKSSNGEPINLTEKIFSLTSSIICRVAFGKACKDNETLITFMKETLNMAAGVGISDLFPSSKIINALDWRKPKLLRMRRRLDVILDGIIKEHEVNLAKFATENVESECDSQRKGNGELGNEDWIDILLRIKGGGELNIPIDNNVIKAVLFGDIFIAGTDTSSTALDWAMAELMRNPRVMIKAQAEVRELFDRCDTIEENDLYKLKYLRLVTKEVLRLHPSVPVLPRTCGKEITINGYTIPAKAGVLINSWAMQRDPKYWTNPESFEPERFENNSIGFVSGDFEYLPFASGSRMCPGMTLGLAHVELPLAQLLYSFNWKLPDGVKPEDMSMSEKLGIVTSRKDNLLIVATPYEPLA